MGKKKQSMLSRNEANTFVKSILEIYQDNPATGFNYKQVAHRLGISDMAGKDLVKLIVEQLCTARKLIRLNQGRFQINKNSPDYVKELKTQLTGIVDMKQTGKAYLIPDDKSEDIFISPNNTHHALNGDSVRIFYSLEEKDIKGKGR